MPVPPNLLDAPETPRRPRWWLEALVIVWLCWAYDAISNLTPLRRVAPYDHARTVLHLEQILHLDPEHALDRWLSAHPTLGWWVSIYYDNAHFVITLAILGWLWWRYSGLYRPLRTSLALINVVGFFVFWRYPMAPPRLAIPSQYPDVVAATHAFGSSHSGTLARHANELAAMPSLHVAWAAWCAYALWSVGARPALKATGRARRHWWAWLAWLYPVVTMFAVMSTGNHYLGDCLAGVATMVITTVAAERWHEWWAARRVIRQLPDEPAVELIEAA